MQDRVPLQVRQHAMPLLGRPSMMPHPHITIALTDDQLANSGVYRPAIELTHWQVQVVLDAVRAAQATDQGLKAGGVYCWGYGCRDRNTVKHSNGYAYCSEHLPRDATAPNTIEARIVQAQRQHDVQMEALNKLNAQIGELAKGIGEEFNTQLAGRTRDDFRAWLTAGQWDDLKADEQRKTRDSAKARGEAWHQHVTDTTMSGNARSMGSFFAGWAAARRWLGR